MIGCLAIFVAALAVGGGGDGVDDLPLRLTIPEVATLARRDVSTVYKDAKAGVLHVEVTGRGNHKRPMTVKRAEALRYAALMEDEGEAYTEAEWEAMHPEAEPPTRVKKDYTDAEWDALDPAERRAMTEPRRRA